MELPYKIEQNEILGRFLVAVRDIKQGEIIMKEKPHLLGTPIAAFTICFKCSSRIYTSVPVPCTECKVVPTCGFCQGKQHDGECNTLQKKNPCLSFKFLCEHPQVVMPLRCLLMKYYNEEGWNELVQLESHLQERKGTYIYNLHRNHVVQLLQEIKIMKMFPDLDEKHDDLIQMVCGILDVNNFEVRPKDCHGVEDCLRGLYLKPALMSHDCMSNTHLSVDEHFLMTVRASLPITQGQTISFNYTNGLLGNYERQMHVQRGKYFSCKCKRCKDPTELGTGLSTLMCPPCKEATLLFNEKNWQCIKCEKSFSSKMVRTTLTLAKERVKEVLKSGNLRDAQDLVKILQRNLHGHHALILEMNQKIISMLSQKGDKNSIQEKIDLCKDLSDVLRVIEPGISRHLGIAQYELQNAQLQLAKLNYNKSSLSLENYAALLMDSERILKGAIEHLIYEPKSTPEGRLARKALTDLQVLRATIKGVNQKVHRHCKKENKS